MTQRILVPIDLEHESACRDIVDVATTIANNEQAHVTLMTVVEAPPVLVSQYLPRRYEKGLHKSTQEALDEIAASMAVAAGPVETIVRFGSVYREILACTESIPTDLIVMGSHNPTVADYLLGGNAARVLRHAECSIFVVRPATAAD